MTVLNFYKKQELELKKYESTVLEICENGDAIIDLPDEMCKELGWKCGDTLNMKLEENGTIVITKISDA